jgi:hypothetical protein
MHTPASGPVAAELIRDSQISDLGVEDVNEHRLSVSAAPRAGFAGAARVDVEMAAEGSEAEVDEVGSAGLLDDAESKCGRGDERGQPDRGGAHVDDVARLYAERGCEP